MPFAAPRPRRARRLWLGVVLAVAGCSAPGEREPPALPGDAPEPPAVAETLSEPSAEEVLACPRGDEPWIGLLARAPTAEALHRLAASCDQAASEHPDRWEPSWALGECHFRLARGALEALEPAREPYERALEIAKRNDQPVGIARAANRLGWIAYLETDYEKAEALYGLALAAGEEVGRDDLVAYAHNNLSGLLQVSGRPHEALEAARRAVVGLRKLGHDRAARTVAFNLAVLSRDLGNFAEAGEELQRLYREALDGEDPAFASKVSAALGSLHRLLDEREVAREWYGRVEREHPRFAAAADLGLGRLALRDAAWEQAAAYLDRAAAQQADPQIAVIAISSRAEVDLRSGRRAEARGRLEPILADTDANADVALEARSLYAKSLLLESGGRNEALRRLREAIEIVEGQAEGLDPGGEGMTFLRSRAEPYADLASALAQDDAAAPAEILRVVEQAHARSLRRMLRGAAGDQPAIVGLEALQARLGPGELLLDFLIGEDRGVVLALGPDIAEAHAIPGWLELRQPVRRWRVALRRPLISAEARLDPSRDLARDLDLGREVRRKLLGPVRRLVDAARRVYVVPDQDLALLPFGALPLDGTAADGGPRYLAELVETAVLPMAGTPASGAGARTPVLLAGDPLPDPAGEFAALPLAGQELSRLRSIWGGNPTELRRDRLSAAALERLELGSFRTIHLATHAVASSLDPRRCAVILSGGERLGMQRIASMKLDSALVVLSACRTGEGEVIPGEGVVGLTWAFLRAGARAVAASLWSVEDASTGELMAAFHARLHAGDDAVRAMAVAQRELAGSRPHPVYWAPFVVVLAPSGS